MFVRRKPQAPIPARWDRRGALSIVVQGGLSRGNAAETATHCQHWRILFPSAEIILAVSSTDMIRGRPVNRVLRKPVLAAAYAEDGEAQAALRVLVESCDKIVLSEGALPLPPIKTVTDRPNNVNLQIAAAKAGLAAATGVHVLRTRSDFVFLDRSFLAQYLDGRAETRGGAATLADRVLISSLFTLNPFTYERMPLHFSDWFHFGLTSDVRMLWDVPPMTLRDAAHYKTHRCAPGSTADERQIVPRLAVEQHIMYHCMKRFFPQLSLDFHNDLSSIDLSLDILTDNFIVADLIAAACKFDKYRVDIDDPAKALHCVTREDWFEMTRTEGASRRAVLQDKAIPALSPERMPFPRIYPAAALRTKVGERNHGEIVGRARPGVLLHGPYDTLPQGEYVATLNTSQVQGSGLLDMRVTLGGGRETLADRQVWIDAGSPLKIDLPFTIAAAKGALFEVVASADFVPMIVVSSVTVSERIPEPERSDPSPPPPLSAQMRSKVGHVIGSSVTTSGKAGHLLFGPYINLEPGAYRVSFLTARATSTGGWSFVEIVSGPGNRTLLRRRIRWSDLATGKLTCDFDLSDGAEDVEFRIRVSRFASFGVDDVQLERMN